MHLLHYQPSQYKPKVTYFPGKLILSLIKNNVQTLAASSSSLYLVVFIMCCLSTLQFCFVELSLMEHGGVFLYHLHQKNK